jgi:hypothetical protein
MHYPQEVPFLSESPDKKRKRRRRKKSKKLHETKGRLSSLSMGQKTLEI